MNPEIEQTEDYTIVRFHGVVDGSLRDATDEMVHPIIEAKCSRVLVDLSGVDRITSEGLSVFVSLVARANSKGSRVVFAQPTPFVKAVFDTTQITKFLETRESLEAAIECLMASVPKSNS